MERNGANIYIKPCGNHGRLNMREEPDLFDVLLQILTDLLFQIIAAGEVKTDDTVKIQSIAYLFSRRFRIDYGFKPCFYGPYSTVVSKELNSLIAAGFIKEESIITADGRQTRLFRLEKGLEETISLGTEEIGVVKDLVDYSKEKLAAAAKTYYVMEVKQVRRYKDIIMYARQFGWSLKKHEIEKAKEILFKIKLLKISQEE